MGQSHFYGKAPAGASDVSVREKVVEQFKGYLEKVAQEAEGVKDSLPDATEVAADVEEALYKFYGK